MEEHNVISTALAPSDAAHWESMQQKLDAWLSLGELITEERAEDIFEYIANQLLCSIGLYYQASHGWVLTCEQYSKLCVTAQWTNDNMPVKEFVAESTILTNWKEMFGENRVVFIPDSNVATRFLEGGTAQNLLGMFCSEKSQQQFLMLLCNIGAKEESYCFLETACHVLQSNGRRPTSSHFTQIETLIEPKQAIDDTAMKKLEYYQTLLAGCDSLFDIDVTADTYQIVTSQLHFVPPQGCYSQQLQRVANEQVHPDDRDVYLKHMKRQNLLSVFEKGNIKKQQLTYRRKNIHGQYCWKNDIVAFIEKDNKQRVIVTSYDFDDQKHDEQLKLESYLQQQEHKHKREIHRKDEIYRIIGEHTKVGAFEWCRLLGREEGFTLSYISPELANEFQFYRQDIHLFKYFWITNRIHQSDQERFGEFLKDPSQTPIQIVCRVTKDGYNYYWYQFTKRTILNKAEGEERMIGTVLNVDEETKASYALKCKARLDSLTGLLNQETFYTEAERRLKNNPDQEYAVIIMDIDNFKLVNSLYGMNAGNRVLAQIGQTLQSCLSKNDVCARVYADVYYIITTYKSDEELVKVLNKMMKRFTYIEHSSLILPSFGISNSKASERSITLLCELASFAHKYGKAHNRERYTFYDVSIRQTIIEEKQMESEMEFAMQSGQFKIYLQPKYVISTRQVVGAEALVRWEHPTKGMIVPAKFISLFEKNGFILRLDEYIWEQVCMLLKKWQTSGEKCIPISVNMSRLHLNNRDCKSTIVNLLQKYNINHKWFELELTENLLFENLNQMISVLTDLQAQGFNINMDDFGSGYSSLNMLRNIPIDILKIDGNFFDEKMLTPKGKTIVKYVVSMAKELNMKVVAEGVENLSQEKFLLEVGCEIAQGFYFSRPMPVSAFESKYWHTK